MHSALITRPFCCSVSVIFNTRYTITHTWHTYTKCMYYTRSTHYQWIFCIVRRIWFYFVFHCAWMALLFSYQIRKCLRQHFLDLQRNFVNITFRIYIKLSPFLTERYMYYIHQLFSIIWWWTSKCDTHTHPYREQSAMCQCKICFNAKP